MEVGSVVLPGERLNIQNVTDKKTKIVVGPGLRRDGDHVTVCKAGILRKRKANTFWVDSYQKRYVPAKGDTIIGVVTNRGSDTVKLDIGASEQATLSFFSFEGASKKNKQNIQVGDVVYGILSVASSYMEPEMDCVDSNLKQGKFGILQDGFLFTCSLSLIYKILNPECPLIKLLGREIKFEIVAGMNGKVWVKANNPKDTIAVANAILWAEFKNNAEMIHITEYIINLKQFKQ